MPLDMSLFLKLQKRVTELEQEKQIMQDELDRKEEQMFRSKAKVSSNSLFQGRGQPRQVVLCLSVAPEFLSYVALTEAVKALTRHCFLYTAKCSNSQNLTIKIQKLLLYFSPQEEERPPIRGAELEYESLKVLKISSQDFEYFVLTRELLRTCLFL